MHRNKEMAQQYRLIREAALQLIEEGYAVFPCDAEKHPLTTNGFKDAVSEPAAARQLWIKAWERPSMIGIATGRMSGNIAVIDVDNKKGKHGSEVLEEWQAQHGRFPETVTAKSGTGGFHYYFRVPEWESIDSPKDVLPGVDIRANDAYIIAPPSIHPCGKPYIWLTEHHAVTDATEADETVLEFLHLKAPKHAYHPSPVRKIESGNRNSTLYYMSRRMQDAGFLDETIEGAILYENLCHCAEPLPEKEVLRIVKSAIKNEKGASQKPKTSATKRLSLKMRCNVELE